MLNMSKVGLHVIPLPNGRFGYAGRVPVELCETVPADRAAIFGRRSFTGHDGAQYMLKSPTFGTEHAAQFFAAARGFEAKTPVKG